MGNRVVTFDEWKQWLCAGCLGFVATFGATLLAQDVTPVSRSSSSNSAAVVPATATSGERVLLLQSGKVVKGVIRQSAAGYVVNVSGGQLVLPFDQVRFEGSDLEDLFRQAQNGLPNDTASSHIELARWCVTNGLLDHARKELRIALKRDPESTIAKGLLQRINDQLLATKEIPAVVQRNGQYSFLGDVKPGIVAETLGGLPREAATEFVTKVQPLLVNRCATAGCHGPGSGNSFELLRAKVGKAPPKSHSEKNLKAVTDRLDLEQPLRSPLLMKLRGEAKTYGVRQSHGGLSAEQLLTLKSWIESISAKPEPPAKTDLVEDDDEPDDEASKSARTAKSSSRPRSKSSTDDELADENLFRQLLRELHDESTKPTTR